MLHTLSTISFRTPKKLRNQRSSMAAVPIVLFDRFIISRATQKNTSSSVSLSLLLLTLLLLKTSLSLSVLSWKTSLTYSLPSSLLLLMAAAIEAADDEAAEALIL
jgi:hypothetical protein